MSKKQSGKGKAVSGEPPAPKETSASDTKRVALNSVVTDPSRLIVDAAGIPNPIGVVMDAANVGLAMEAARSANSIMEAAKVGRDAVRITNPIMEAAKVGMDAARITNPIMEAAKVGMDAVRFTNPILNIDQATVLDRARITFANVPSSSLSRSQMLIALGGDPSTLRVTPETVTIDERLRRLETDTAKEIKGYEAQLAQAKVHQGKAEALAAAKQAALDAIVAQERLKFVRDRVHPGVMAALPDELLAKFTAAEPQPMFVMSVDIRRSTELMLEARTPQNFAKFVTQLCDKLVTIIFEHFGVVDKFTGDGILCFFPEFLSGASAGANAVAAAIKCHEAFEHQYRSDRDLFEVVRTDAGIGIGIDHGDCHFVNVSGALTVVGRPVVHACRFGGGSAGSTLLNQAAYTAIQKRHGTAVRFGETSLDIKHQGPRLAYSAELVDLEYQPVPPAWLTESLTARAGLAAEQSQKP